MEGELPADGAAPVVADDDGFVAAEVFDDGGDVGYQQAHVVVFGAFGLVAQVVAAEVDGGDLVLRGEGFHLVAPGVPEIGEAVDHDDERALAGGDVVDLDAVRVGVAVLVLDGREGRGEEEGEDGCAH